MNDLPDEVGHLFQLQGAPSTAVVHGNGNVNDTFLVSCEEAGKLSRYTIQRINHEVFTDPEGLMENFSRVTTHLEQCANPEERSIRLIPSVHGAPYARDGQGNYWRAMEYVDRSKSVDVPENPEQAYEAARTFGAFQARLADLPGDPLRETIPDFHNTRKRFDDFRQVVEKDPAGRLDEARDLVAFATQRESLADCIDSSKFPTRIVHNDTKLNNVLLDKDTGKGICVVDLDTVMPGCALHDFGDLVRTAASSAEEDEPDASKIHFLPDTFEAIVKGYLESAGSFLTEEEIRRLPDAPGVITFEIGIRFLADYLAGDVYFKTKRPNHNLARARAQFKLLSSMENHREEMKAITDRNALAFHGAPKAPRP